MSSISSDQLSVVEEIDSLVGVSFSFIYMINLEIKNKLGILKPSDAV